MNEGQLHFLQLSIELFHREDFGQSHLMKVVMQLQRRTRVAVVNELDDERVLMNQHRVNGAIKLKERFVVRLHCEFPQEFQPPDNRASAGKSGQH